MEYDSRGAYPQSPSFADLIVMPRGRGRRLTASFLSRTAALSPYRWTVRVPLTAIRIGNQSFELAAPSVCPSREAAAMEEADITPESFSGDISLEEMEASCWGAALTPDISSGTTGLHDLVSALRTRVRSVLLPLANIAPTKNKTIVRPA